MENNRFWDKTCPKNYKQQIPLKTAHQNRNQHMAMCPCIKFQSISRTYDFGTKFAQTFLNDKIMKKYTLKTQ